MLHIYKSEIKIKEAESCNFDSTQLLLDIYITQVWSVLL